MKKPNFFIWRFIWNSELAKQNLGAMAEGNCWIAQMEDKFKRMIFLRPFGFICGFEGVEKPEPASTAGRPEKTTEGGPAKRVRSVRLEGEGFSTSAGTWKTLKYKLSVIIFHKKVQKVIVFHVCSKNVSTFHKK